MHAATWARPPGSHMGPGGQVGQVRGGPEIQGAGWPHGHPAHLGPRWAGGPGWPEIQGGHLGPKVGQQAKTPVASRHVSHEVYRVSKRFVGQDPHRTCVTWGGRLPRGKHVGQQAWTRSESPIPQDELGATIVPRKSQTQAPNGNEGDSFPDGRRVVSVLGTYQVT